jgi:uncharacterized surface protein with fasciclin (FAS1) repeats
MIRKYLTSALLGGLAAAATLFAGENPMVGGAPMYADKNIVQNAMNSKDHIMLMQSNGVIHVVDKVLMP